MFTKFQLATALTKAIEEKGFTKPTDVQAKTIPEILEGKDVLVGAETGSGKTIAYLLPLLQKLILQRAKSGVNWGKGNHVRALILVPTRELAQQVRDETLFFAQRIYPKMTCKAVYGGVDLESQIRNLATGSEVLVATPARVMRMLENKAIKFDKLRTVIVDEADRMVSKSFKEELERVLEELPPERQSLLFTATLPDSIRWLVRELLDAPVIINIDDTTEERIEERVVTVNRGKKLALLQHLLETEDWKQVLVFATSKKSCSKLYRELSEEHDDVAVLHSNLPQKVRSEAIEKFKEGKARVLICTDVAARGLDVEALPCVINYELPREPNDYTHRIGRTGRAGNAGMAISLIAHHEYAHFDVIEKRIGMRLERERVEGFEAAAKAPSAPNSAKKDKKKKTKRNKVSKKKKSKKT